jgi:hypothetical protein
VETQAVEDKDLLAALQAAIGRGEIDVLLDIRRQHHVDSPVYRQSDSSLAVYILLIATSAVTYFAGWQAGLAAAAISVLVYALVVRRFVAKLMRRRLLVEVLADPEDFRKAWKLKGLGFHHKPSGTVCESPDGRWRSFILERCPPAEAAQS